MCLLEDIQMLGFKAESMYTIWPRAPLQFKLLAVYSSYLFTTHAFLRESRNGYGATDYFRTAKVVISFKFENRTYHPLIWQ